MASADALARYTLLNMDASHLESVVQLEQASTTHPWSEASFRRELDENPLSRPRIAISLVEPREVVGFCIAWIVSDEVQIQNVAVAERHRRVGLGGYLLNDAFEYGVRGGARGAFLEVRRANEAAMKLYESLGFDVVGERKDYYAQPRDDAILLRKDLR